MADTASFWNMQAAIQGILKANPGAPVTFAVGPDFPAADNFMALLAAAEQTDFAAPLPAMQPVQVAQPPQPTQCTQPAQPAQPAQPIQTVLLMETQSKHSSFPANIPDFSPLVRILLNFPNGLAINQVTRKLKALMFIEKDPQQLAAMTRLLGTTQEARTGASIVTEMSIAVHCENCVYYSNKGTAYPAVRLANRKTPYHAFCQTPMVLAIAGLPVATE
ncbi:hypothetical protein OC834_006157 [Tilletia horrida]|nr:hypothetical protein OC834_006157 [Tilletia horrida]